MNIRDEIQVDALAKIDASAFSQGNKKTLVVAATGFGKGHLIKLFCEKHSHLKIVVIVPRVNLVRDLAQRTGGSIYCASLGKKEFTNLTVATKQSVRHLDADVLILDECHQYRDEFVEFCEDSSKYIIGMTATPYTQHGFIYGENKTWNDPVFEFSAKDAIDNKILCEYKIQGSGNSYIVSGKKRTREFTQAEVDDIINKQGNKLSKIVEEIIAFSDKYERKKIVMLCASIEHAEQVTHYFSLNNIKCDLVHSKIPGANDIIEKWKHNSDKFVSSVLMLSEGFDCPEVDCVVFLRPTRSTRLAMQAIGRGLRISEGKEFCLILDFAQVTDNCGTPAHPIYNFKAKSDSDDDEGVLVLKTCESCWFKYESDDYICPECGHDNTPKRDYSEKLESSLLETKPDPFFIYTTDDVKKRGFSKNGREYMIIENRGISVTLFGKQVNWFFNIAKHTSYIKISIKKSGKWRNATNLDFGSFKEYEHFKNLNSLQLYSEYPDLF